jgi:hypothetical protein
MWLQTRLTRRWRFAALGLLTLPFGVAAAADAGFGLFPYVAAGVTHTDNFDRTVSDAVSETLLLGEAGARYLRDSTRSTIDLTGAVTRVHYDQGRADDETRGQVNADLLFDLVPERAELILLDRYGQIAPGSYGALNPVNRENVNYVAAGPRAALPVGGASEVELAALAGRSDYETSDLGADRWSAQAALTDRLSLRRSVSVNFLHSDTRFRELPGRPELKSSSGFLRFDTVARRSSFGVEAGYTHVDNDVATDSDLMAAASLAMRAGAYTEFTLDVSHGFRDTISSFLLSENLAGFGDFNFDRNVIATSDFGRDTTARAGVSVTRERTKLAAGVSWSDERFVSQSTLDRKVLGADVEAARELGARSVVRFTGAYYREESATGALASRLVTGDVGLSYVATQRLSVDLDGQTIRFTTPGGSLSENRLMLQLRYQLAPIGRVAALTEAPPTRSRLPDDLLDMRRVRAGN